MDDSILVAPGQWLVADEGTAQNVSNKLGITITPPSADFTPTSTAIVVAVSGYFGRIGANVWEWVKAKWGTA